METKCDALKVCHIKCVYVVIWCCCCRLCGSAFRFCYMFIHFWADRPLSKQAMMYSCVAVCVYVCGIFSSHFERSVKHWWCVTCSVSLFFILPPFHSSNGNNFIQRERHKTENVPNTLPNCSHQEWKMMFQKMYDNRIKPRYYEIKAKAHTYVHTHTSSRMSVNVCTRDLSVAITL